MEPELSELDGDLIKALTYVKKKLGTMSCRVLNTNLFIHKLLNTKIDGEVTVQIGMSKSISGKAISINQLSYYENFDLFESIDDCLIRPCGKYFIVEIGLNNNNARLDLIINK